MPEFLELLPPTKALERLFENLQTEPEPEIIKTIHALNRVTFSNIFAPHQLPLFIRSTVDGYAVQAKDTFGASASLPAYMEMVGEIKMGAIPEFDIAPHQCALIHTGGMLPGSADAVVMVEYTQKINGSEIEILGSVAPNENVIQVGEDVVKDQEILPAGMKLRPADIGGLISLGITTLEVSKRPIVGILSSGDELINPEMDLSPGKVRDINSYSLSAFVERYGGLPNRYPIVPDDLSILEKKAQRVLSESDILVFTAGSSASARDLTAQVINKLGSPGVIVHGINIRPGKPTILAVCDNKPVIGLPGNPVSALVIAERFLKPVMDMLLGEKSPQPKPMVNASLSINLSSQSGREDWVPVRLISTASGLIADPVFGKSNLIFSLSQADGLICIHADANGISAYELVEVYLI